MCTVSVIPLADGYRLCTNRDEDPTRESPEQVADHPLGARRALFPRDPQGGGTWIGVNDAGVIVTLLNGNPERPFQPADPRSRGGLVTALLAAESTAAATALIAGLAWNAYRPCRLLVIAADGWRSWWWNGAGPEVQELDPGRAHCFASSGLGDHRVAAPRARLFAEMTAAGCDPAVQDAFHRHRWPERPELSVDMWRPDACTVSLTCVRVGSGQAELLHHPAPPHQAAELQTRSLPLRDPAQR